MPAKTRPALALLLAAAALAGCASEGPPVRERTRSFTVTLDDYLIRPQTIRVPVGGRLTVTVVNRGRLGHTFRIRAGETNVLKFTTVRPGTRATRTFRLRPGRYVMYCALANHEELGMHGTLTVG
jgi:plastocyanin